MAEPAQIATPKLVKLWPGTESGSGFMDKPKAEAWSLVLLSVNITHRMIQSHKGWEILVNEGDAVSARHHLEHFEIENSQWPPHIKSMPESRPLISWWSLVFCGLLVGFFMVTGPWSEGSVYFAKGAIHSGSVKADFQWWRIVTALTLHADLGHVAGNVCLGGVLILFLSGLTGTGTAWLLTILAGSIGNLLNIYLHGGSYNSVGFSTAVFGIIGIFCGIRVFRDGVVTVLLPLGAGFGLLAMLGSGGERTDLGAHVWGMVSGVGLGALYYWLDPALGYAQKKIQQNFFASLVLLAVVACWFVALSA